MKWVIRVIALLLLFLFNNRTSYSWGFFGHRLINQKAVWLLPSSMLGFYKNNISFIVEQAVAPDKRRYRVDDEAPKHYIDMEYYGSLNDSIKYFFEKATLYFGKDSLHLHGNLPWNLMHEYYKLRAAFKEKNVAGILKYSAEIGHYIADAHVPLHTTKNYNGQYTGQNGIHAFWESRLPELFSEKYDFILPEAVYVKDVKSYFWKIIDETNSLTAEVLSKEKHISDSIADELKFSFEAKNTMYSKKYSHYYSDKYHRALNGMVENQMQKSITAIASIWYTAWIEAGQPDLNDLNLAPPDNTVIEDSSSVNKMILKGHED